MKFIYIFLLFARRIEGGASQAGPGLRLQWNLPELAAHLILQDGAVRRLPHLKCARRAYTQVGTGLASMLAHQSSLRPGEKKLKEGDGAS